MNRIGGRAVRPSADMAAHVHVRMANFRRPDGYVVYINGESMRCLDISELEFVAGGLDYGSPEGLGDVNNDGIGDIEIIGEKMEWWEKVWEDIKDIFTSDPNAPDQPEQPTEPTYTYDAGLYYGSVGAIGPWGVGGSVTVTSQGDVLVTGLVGTPGPVGTIGATPPGTNASYLEGGATNINIGTGAGVSIPEQGGINNAHPTWGTPGLSYGETVNAVDAAQAAAEQAQAEAIRIANEAAAWANQRGGVYDHIP